MGISHFARIDSFALFFVIPMAARTKQVAVLGSTGSIGRSALEVIEASGGQLRAAALVAHRQTELLLAQARRHRPDRVVVVDAKASRQQDWSTLPPETDLCCGEAAVLELVACPEIDVVLSAIVGAAGLRGTWAALEASKTVALANKESLVMAGPLITRLARAKQSHLLPVDSEHSAVFQALQAGRREEVERVVLTASGGPFREHTAAELAGVTVEEALDHPTWSMGPKITIDSATLMNKALEIIEARWLFDLAPEQIGVVIHPQSIVHSMVEYIDGSVIAQLSPPDMKLPIQYALYWPQRRAGIAPRLDWSQAWQLEFSPPDFDRFPALLLGLEAAERGGTAGAVLNAVNEEAVAAFLRGELGFDRIVPACRDVLEHHTFDPDPTLPALMALDRWAREEIKRWISA